MPFDYNDVSSDLPLSLFLRYQTTEPPFSWLNWGKTLPDLPGVWHFRVKDREHLLDLLELLMLQTPSHELMETIAICMPCLEGSSFDLSHFSTCQTLPALHARLKHPWITEDLTPYVQMHLQPIVDLVRGGQVFAYESLCRMRTPDGTLLSGAEAFRLARRAHRTTDLDLTCIENSLVSKARLLPQGVPVFININPGTLLGIDPVTHFVWDRMKSLGVSPQEVVFELIESDQVNPEALVDACDILRSMGFRIAMDDVGTGYNGLTKLAMLNPDFVKLDRSLVHRVQGSRVRLVLLEALISMSQRLGCATIAEGLERAEDVALCLDMGIHYAQGYFFARPSPSPVEFEPLPLPKAKPTLSFRGMIRLSDFVDPTPTLPINASLTSAQVLFRTFPDLPLVVILDDKKPVGYVTRNSLAFAYKHKTGLGNYCRPVTKLLRDHVLRSGLAQRLYQETDTTQPWIVVNDDNDYLGTIQPWTILSRLLSRNGNEELHPLSLLPTGPVLRSTLDLRLQSGRNTVLVYIDLDYFKAFNDRYGFVRGDAMIKLLAEILRQECSTWPDVFIGHIGGDDFIVILPADTSDLPDKLRRIAESFHRLSNHLYDARDLQCGFYVTEEDTCYPVAALSIIVMDGSKKNLSNSLKAGERAAQLKKMAKAHVGSVIVMEGDPPNLLPIQLSLHRQGWQDTAVAALMGVSRYRRDKNHHDLDIKFKEYPFFELIYELDRKGVQRYPNWVNPLMRGRIKGGGVGIDRSSRPYFKVVRETQAPYVSSIYLSSATDDFCVTVSVPLMDKESFDGILIADISLAGLVSMKGASE